MADHPFIVYRARLDVYERAMAAGWSDERFVELVERLDAHVADVDGHGFAVTPLTDERALSEALGLDRRLLVKDETGNVSGSHKARHLFGTMLTLAVDGARDDDLAIASCGNAALAAAVVARAENRRLRVFIPTWADPVVVGSLERLGADITTCERRTGEVGDPAFLRFTEAVEAGAQPFSVQGPSTPSALDGGRTIGWELADQLADLGVAGPTRVFVQVGGGALAACTFSGILQGAAPSLDPRFHAVQGEACAPLHRAWRSLGDELVGAGVPDRQLAAQMSPADAVAAGRADPDRHMWAWEEVGTSVATGILDDVTYDWLSVVGPMAATRGWPVVVPERDLVEAHRLANTHTDIRVDDTGSAGLAGLGDSEVLADLMADETIVVLFTGRERHN